MPYYHVILSLKSRPDEDALATDLSEEDLRNNILEPLLEGQKFVCHEELVTPDDVESVRITETDEPLHKVIGSSFIPSYAEYWQAATKAEDVTADYLPKLTRKTKMPSRTISPSVDVFLVHGRDHKPMKELKTMLKEFGLNPIVLEELPGGSMTIIEKLEKYLDEVGYAFAILTPDDLGCLGKQFMNLHSESLFKKGESEADKNKKARFFSREVPKLLMNRARQNVMLEFGCCIAKLGRERVCCLYKRYVELPSDMNGILHIRFEESLNEVRDKIVKELKAAGYENIRA